MRTYLQLLEPDGSGGFSALSVWGQQVAAPSLDDLEDSGVFSRSGSVSYRVTLPSRSVSTDWYMRVQGDENRQYRVTGVEYDGPLGLSAVLACESNRSKLNVIRVVGIGADALGIDDDRRIAV